MESPQVTADVIQANEFGRLSAQYAVQAVPKTVVNDVVDFLGAVPEARFVREVLRAFSSGESPAEPPAAEI